MLAALPPQQVDALFPSRRALVRRHDAGPASLTQLRALLARARRDGHAEEDGFVTPGFASVAAPVLDHSGAPGRGGRDHLSHGRGRPVGARRPRAPLGRARLGADQSSANATAARDDSVCPRRHAWVNSASPSARVPAAASSF